MPANHWALYWDSDSDTGNDRMKAPLMPSTTSTRPDVELMADRAYRMSVLRSTARLRGTHGSLR